MRDEISNKLPSPKMGAGLIVEALEDNDDTDDTVTECWKRASSFREKPKLNIYS
jgi:hypothetical protein